MMTHKLKTFLILASMYLSACVSNSIDQDCITITGATFSSDGGKLQSILMTKCAGVACHSAGGAAANHWIIGAYEKLDNHFFDESLNAVMGGSMPPAGSTKLTGDELALFECWSSARFPKLLIFNFMEYTQLPSIGLADVIFGEGGSHIADSNESLV